MSANNRTTILKLTNFQHYDFANFGDDYEFLDGNGNVKLKDVLATRAGDIRGILTIGSVGATSELIDKLPRLEIISCLGAGFENVDLAAAKKRGITVTHGKDVNSDSVADHAMALVLAIARDLVQTDKNVRLGKWRDDLPTATQVSGLAIGILGLGTIGEKIARRALAFDMSVYYYNRKLIPNSIYTYCESLAELARRSDFLVVAVPGGATTKHLVDARILKELGPKGFIVNIGRGSIINTSDLVKALRENQIAGAALDVMENEPQINEDLRTLANVILTPHVAGRSPQAIRTTVDFCKANLDRKFSGQSVLAEVHAD